MKDINEMKAITVERNGHGALCHHSVW